MGTLNLAFPRVEGDASLDFGRVLGTEAAISTTLADDVVAFSTSFIAPITASLVASLADDAVSFDAMFLAPGTSIIDVTLADDSVAFSATFAAPITASMGVQLSDDVAAFSVSFAAPIYASLTSTLNDDAVNVSVSFIPPIYVSVAAQLADDVVAVNTHIIPAISASMSASLANDSVALITYTPIIIDVLDSGTSQDVLATNTLGTYTHLDSHTTSDLLVVNVVSAYEVIDTHVTEDGIAITLTLDVLDAATHQTILTRDVHITAEIIDSGRTEDGFTAWRVAEVEVYDAANNVDGVAVVWEVDLLDAVQHADLLSVNVTSTADVLDVAQALSEALGNALVELVLLDQSATQELFDYEAIRNAEILDAALAQALLGTDGDKAFYTYALNTLLNAGSRYGNHNFNSYAATDTACYAAGEGGVFLLSGDDDEGYTIPAGFRTNITDLRTEDAPEGARPRSVQYAYLGMTSSGELRLKASAANGGAVDTRTYRVRQTGDTFDNTTRVVMGKGVQARYWQFTIENIHGEAFDIDQIELLPVARTRRI